MTLIEIYEASAQALNKDQVDSSFGPAEFQNIIVLVNRELLCDQVGLPRDYGVQNTGEFIPRKAFFQALKINTENVQHLIKTAGKNGVEALKVVNGLASFPSDYFYPVEAEYQYVENSGSGSTQKVSPVEILPYSSFSNRKRSPVLKPTVKYPMATIKGGGIEVLPVQVTRLVFTYLRKPVSPLFQYTIDSNDNIIYDSINSVEFEWPDHMYPDVVDRVIKRASEAFANTVSMQSSNERLNT